MRGGEPIRDSDYWTVYQIYSLLSELWAVSAGRHESTNSREGDRYTRGRHYRMNREYMMKQKLHKVRRKGKGEKRREGEVSYRST
jgi:hypothetical protein